MGWIQDFVPNHMAFNPQNKWISDLMEKGDASVYNVYFDHQPNQKIMAPFLDRPLAEAIDGGAISIIIRKGRLRIKYREHEFPVNATSAKTIVKRLAAFRASRSPLVDNTVTTQNGLKKINADHPFLKRILDEQYYRLCQDKETRYRINYRRFFTVNSLICLNMQDDTVFQDYHKLMLRLIEEDLIQGVRIDHVDGLSDPAAYLGKLRKHIGNDVYIVVEKILGFNEPFPNDWVVEGTTGYDFLATVNKALTNDRAEPAFSRFYEEITSSSVNDTGGALVSAKAQLLFDHFAGELQNLLDLFTGLPQSDHQAGMDKEDFRNIIAALLIYCPVYRFYPDSIPLTGKDAEDFRALMSVIKRSNTVSEAALSVFEKCFLEKEYPNTGTPASRLYFLRRCMQLSGPLMAKGMEDTLMYRYARFIAHNEVGNDLKTFGITTEAFHKRMAARQKYLPLTLNTTATHDMKRGEDARARLQILSFQPEQWLKNVRLWLKQSAQYAGDLALTDQYFIIQNIAGTYPYEPGKHYLARLKAYLQKAAREAKLRSSWESPDKNYEQQLFRFAVSFVKSPPGKELLRYLKTNEKRFIINSLAQLALKCTSPGIPDIYQGSELWDLSFVDPDNRKPVDYEKRSAYLNEVLHNDICPGELLNSGKDGKIKLFTLFKLLGLRKKHPELFERGRYEKIQFPGPESYIAFSRSYKEQRIIVIMPKGGAIPSAAAPFRPARQGPGEWKNIFTDEIYQTSAIPITALFRGFPIAVLDWLPLPQKRGAGILLPVFSLTSNFGIGGLGKEAFAFADFLARSGQKYWQILPLNPVSGAQAYSPYAPCSAFAAEPLFIDPVKLKAYGLLPKKETGMTSLGNKVDYASALHLKNRLFKKAWANYNRGIFRKMRQEFEAFCAAQSWLDDYALYQVIKEQSGNKPWPEWPAALRNRSRKALKKTALNNANALAYQKWLQFLFEKQWQELKLYCEQLNIKLIGDLPFYVSLDSADVWAHQHIFSIDAKGNCRFKSGVPPDYFNANGQLWEMPTYDWNALKKEGYRWWIQRLKRNALLYHFTRLDHFRGFYNYWAVPPTASSAQKGKWKAGPRELLWRIIKKELPAMPFIAEDLGDLGSGVYDLCDRFRLPGMRVLQQGFDNYDAANRNLPHNYIPHSVVYTGTHDNNTTAGWYPSLSEDTKKAISRYAGHHVDEQNIADVLMETAYKSIAEIAVIPLQDVLGTGTYSRINTPGSASAENWTWRMETEINANAANRLLKSACIYNRF